MKFKVEFHPTPTKAEGPAKMAPIAQPHQVPPIRSPDFPPSAMAVRDDRKSCEVCGIRKEVATISGFHVCTHCSHYIGMK